MKKGIFSKLIITTITIISISFIMTAGFLSFWFQSYYFQQRRGQLITESQFIGAAAVQYLQGSVQSQRLNDTLTYISSYLSADIWLVDNYGYVFAVSDQEHKNLIGNNQMFTNDLKELRSNHIIERKGDFDNLFKTPVHSLEVPIFHKGMFVGTVIIHTSLNEIKGPLKRVYEIIWVSAVFAIVACCFAIYFLSQRIIIKPLAEINLVADKIAKGEVDKRVKIKSNDEIGELSKSFNIMADSLEKVEKNRREFISNVSHEIRSPITSIKGFIGGILDGIIPKGKERYYLSVTYEETQRLTRLVNDLLDLSAIEAGQLKLKMEQLDINELIRLAVIKFQTRIKAKKLAVDVCLNEENLYVVGDRDRITQVLTNLLDNAVKYGKNGGNININTKTKGDKILVSIYNDGEGISEDDLTHIWDRFYKADKSRTSKVSTGLGLPIVRSILTSLGEDIWVENKEGEGVTFTFSLKRI